MAIATGKLTGIYRLPIRGNSRSRDQFFAGGLLRFPPAGFGRVSSMFVGMAAPSSADASLR
ncbi:hypothetical protein M2284_001526 [Rhodococcus sp. LBL1]|uniref:Uncharacterized protein n=1 Tax=Prescottella agglutinans TaxID=1644129 RepID=A0ABT6MHV1_9NOCA|nr:hypothetical protein [Prescottella agglutinans]MDH6677328.1 hypothetical protein [Rhodococcus sp. LBL1]MDH6682378.1 hypothetical protein [Rhodococcus sp. LBL2]